MDVLTYSDARANLKAVMDSVVDDHAPVIIARQRGRAVVMVSLEDWAAMAETEYLLSSPINAARLRKARRELEGDGGSERELLPA